MSAYTEWLDTVSEEIQKDFLEFEFSDPQLMIIGSWLEAAFDEGCSNGKYGS
jgi:hypothetical protein